MKTKSPFFLSLLVVCLLFAVAAPGAQAAGRSGNSDSGGFGNFVPLYTCTEVHPNDASNPAVALFTRLPDDTIQLLVRPTILSTQNSSEFIYSGDVVRDESVKCFISCEIFNNSLDLIQFSITDIGSLVQGFFSGPTRSIEFSCLKH